MGVGDFGCCALDPGEFVLILVILVFLVGFFSRVCGVMVIAGLLLWWLWSAVCFPGTCCFFVVVCCVYVGCWMCGFEF